MTSEGRFTWLFATPNQAAIACAMVALFGIWLWSLSARFTNIRHHQLRWATAWTAAGLCLAGLYFLAATHSRAGWIGYCVGCITLWLWRCVDIKTTVFSAILLIVFVFLTPGGSGRFESVIDGTAPGGRFEAWRSALCLIFDYPLTGIGSDFPIIFGSWYLPKEYDQRFFTALNDALTFAGWHGLPALMAAVTAISSLYLIAWDLRESPICPLLALGLSLLSLHLAMGQFQAHQWWPFPRFTGAASLLLIGVGITIGLWRSRPYTPWRSRIATAAAIGITSTTVLYLVSWASTTDFPAKTYISGSGQFTATSRQGSERGNITIFVDDDGERRRICHGLSLALLKQGFSVVVSQGKQRTWTAALIRSGCLRPSMIVGCGESCAQAYEMADMALPIVVEPSDLPSSKPPDQPLLIITSKNAPFTASPTDIAHCMADNKNIEHRLLDTTSDESAALAIAAWASARGRR